MEALGPVWLVLLFGWHVARLFDIRSNYSS
jgi:hypothetical protein